MKHIIKSLAVSTLLLMAITLKAQKPANVKGTWNMEVESAMGKGTPVFVLTHATETTLTGTYKGRLGESTVEGTVKGNVIHLQFTINGGLIEYDGTVDGDSMKGKIKFSTMGEGTFAGTRKK